MVMASKRKKETKPSSAQTAYPRRTRSSSARLAPPPAAPVDPAPKRRNLANEKGKGQAKVSDGVEPAEPSSAALASDGAGTVSRKTIIEEASNSTMHRQRRGKSMQTLAQKSGGEIPSLSLVPQLEGANNPLTQSPLPSQVEGFSSRAASSSIRRRGPTRGVGNFGQRYGQKMQLEWNDLNQPTGDNSSHFSNLLGVVVRYSGHASLQVKKWPDVPDQAKERMWRDIVQLVDITEDRKKWVMLAMGKKFKDWRNGLKKHYNAGRTDDERLRNKPEGISDLDWAWLVHYWSSPEAQAVSARNIQNRAKLVTKHTGGTKSFAQYRDEEARSREDGTAPSRVDMFIKTHTRNDGSLSDPTSAMIISKFKEYQESGASSSTPIDDDIYTVVMGPERHGRMRGMGIGPTPTSYYGHAPSAHVSHLELNEMREQMAQVMNVQMEQKLTEMREQMQSEMQQQMTLFFRSVQPQMPSERKHATSSSDDEAEDLASPHSCVKSTRV